MTQELEVHMVPSARLRFLIHTGSSTTVQPQASQKGSFLKATSPVFLITLLASAPYESPWRECMPVLPSL